MTPVHYSPEWRVNRAAAARGAAVDSAYAQALAALAPKIGYRNAATWLEKPSPEFAGRSPRDHLEAGGDLTAVLTATEQLDQGPQPKKGHPMTSKLTGQNAAVAGGGIGAALATVAMYAIPGLRDIPADQAAPMAAALTVLFTWLIRYIPKPRGGAPGVILVCLFISGCAGGGYRPPPGVIAEPDTAQMIDTQCTAAASAIRTLTVFKQVGRLDAQTIADVDAARAIINGICGRLDRPTGMQYLAAVQTALLQIQMAKTRAVATRE